MLVTLSAALAVLVTFPTQYQNSAGALRRVRHFRFFSCIYVVSPRCTPKSGHMLDALLELDSLSRASTRDTVCRMYSLSAVRLNAFMYNYPRALDHFPSMIAPLPLADDHAPPRRRGPPCGPPRLPSNRSRSHTTAAVQSLRHVAAAAEFYSFALARARPHTARSAPQASCHPAL